MFTMSRPAMISMSSLFEEVGKGPLCTFRPPYETQSSRYFTVVALVLIPLKPDPRSDHSGSQRPAQGQSNILIGQVFSFFQRSSYSPACWDAQH
jgi:hypothetical protein